MEFNQEILDFIERRWRGHEEIFLNGNCYWFAQILCERFPTLQMAYEPISGHFVAYDTLNCIAYDVTGECALAQKPLSLAWIQTCEPNWYQRILKNCRD